VQKLSASERGFQMTGVELKGALKAQQSVRRAFQVLKRKAKICPKPCIVRLELDCFVKSFQSVVAPTLALEGGSKIREVFCFGTLPDCVCDPLYGVIVLPLSKGQEAHEMQRVCMMGIELKSSLTAHLRFEKSSGLRVVKAGFIQLHDAAGTARSRPGSSGRSTTLATVHLRIPRELRAQDSTIRLFTSRSHRARLPPIGNSIMFAERLRIARDQAGIRAASSSRTRSTTLGHSRVAL
jgi:hypothetical protein